jgi:hypothetical protein
MKFTWDRIKARNNYVKHGVSFYLAKAIFKDPFAIEFLDDRQDYGEERFVIIGSVGTQILYVAYTERKGVIRIISARRATKHEQETYLQENP